MRISWDSIVSRAALYGFDRIALIPAQPLSFISNRESDRQGILMDPKALLPSATSVLIGAMPFHWFGNWPQGTAEISAFYCQSQRAHLGIRALEDWLARQGIAVSGKQELPQKPIGQFARLGTIGRNQLLANAIWGSCFTLRILVTDLPPDVGMPVAMPEAVACGSCVRCRDACPTGALDGLGGFDSPKCLRAYMLAGEIVPETMRKKMENRLLGCEICQRVCPRNKAIPEQTPVNTESFLIDRLLTGARGDLDAIAKAIGWNEARLQRVQAQAALLAGNSGDPRYLPLLRLLKNHQRPSIGEHARWAIGQIERRMEIC